MEQISISIVQPNSPLLHEIIALGDKYRRFLGILSHEVFSERAERKCILVALSGNKVAGYLMFYKAERGYIRITHMCVDEAFRKSGIARSLFSALVEQSKEYRSILLSCRKDYESCAFWPQLGFVFVAVRNGRGTRKTELVDYKFALTHPSLLDEDRPDERCADIVIDANVLFDLEDGSRNGALESTGLLAEWLEPMIRLCVTEEHHNELKRNGVSAADAARRLAPYHTIETDSVEFLAVHPRVVGLLPKAVNEQEAADRRHLSRAIVSAAVAFVTRDTGLLVHADEVYRTFGLRVMRPSVLIGSLDEVRNEAEYQRDRLVGTSVHISKANSEAEILATAFTDQTCERRVADLRSKINGWLAFPDRYTVCVIAEGDDQLLACTCLEKAEDGGLRVHLVRTRPEARLLRRFRTIQQCVVVTILQHAIKVRSWYIEVDSCSGPADLLGKLINFGFHQFGNKYFKLCPKIIGTPSQILAELSSRASAGQAAREFQEPFRLLSTAESTIAFDVEKKFWPAKVIGCGIPTFTVAIEPRWAKHLIGAGASDSDLFGADTERAFNFESVYYKSARNQCVRPRGRILWYVSKDREFNWSGFLVACSQVDCVELGNVKLLFKKYERFGVYNFVDVLQSAAGDISQDVLALRFSNTEQLVSPISFARAKAVLSEHGRWNNFQSPMEITEEDFLVFYAGS